MSTFHATRRGTNSMLRRKAAAVLLMPLLMHAPLRASQAAHHAVQGSAALRHAASRNYACYDNVYSTTRCEMKRSAPLALLLLEVHLEHGLVPEPAVPDDVVHVQEELGELVCEIVEETRRERTKVPFRTWLEVLVVVFLMSASSS